VAPVDIRLTRSWIAEVASLPAHTIRRMTPPAEAGPWTLPHRIAFRFLFVYFVFAFPSAILQLVPVVGGLGYFLEMAIRPFYVWVGKVAFGLEITVFPNGSGDTTFNWIQAGTNLGIAMLATGIWSAADRRRTSYPWLKDALWTLMRFVLASAMLGYGINKVFALQFPPPGMQRLLQQYGDSSPMGLMWTFMGASPAYVMFAGWMETIGGLLLLFRRTQLLGAMLVAGVMANVFVLNMCYDVPVKLYSFHLMAMALVIAAPDAARMWNLFVMNRPVEPADLVGPWTNAIARRVAIGVKFAWITVTVPLVVWQMQQMSTLYGPNAPTGPLDGTWEVTRFVRDGVELPPRWDEPLRWRFLTLMDLPERKVAKITHAKGPNERWTLAIAPGDTDRTGTLSFSEMTQAAGSGEQPPPPIATVTYRWDGADSLTVTGTVAGATIDATCTRLRPTDYLLINRGFRWINETPYNR
jgi:hypothetical protein